MAYTSATHPLKIASVPTGTGRIGLTFRPGKRQLYAASGSWDRDLRADLDVVEEWGASALVCLLEPRELADLKVTELSAGSVLPATRNTDDGCSAASSVALSATLLATRWSYDRLDRIRRRHGPDGLQEPVLNKGKLVVSDDTQMTLFTLEGLLEAADEDVPAIAERIRLAYLDWLVTQLGAPAGRNHRPAPRGRDQSERKRAPASIAPREIAAST